MKKLLIIFWIIMFSLVVTAGSYTFKQNEDTNFRWRCFDDNNYYCSSSTIITISIESPNGTNVIDNSSMTWNATYYNHTLPTTNLGTYTAIITSPSNTNSTWEFTYDVTITGEKVSLSNIVIVLAFLIVGIILFVIGYSIDSEKWILKTSFYLFTLLMGLLAINSGGIIASESLGLSKMSTVGLVLIISIILVMILYMFIYWTIQTFKQIKNKREIRWNY